MTRGRTARAFAIVRTAPRGKARPRFVRGRVYSPSSACPQTAAIRLAWQKANGEEWAAWKGPVRVCIHAWRKPTKAHLSLKSPAPRSSAHWRPDTSVPDVDNVAKLVLDALNGLAWADDAQVTRVCVCKHARNPVVGELVAVGVEYPGARRG